MLEKIFLRLGFFCLLLLCFAKSTFATYYTTQINSSTYRNLGTPEGIIRLADGNLWYADSTNYRIVKISPTGTILRTVGRQGTDEGEFEYTVKGITKDNSGNLYVLDYCHVYKFDSYGGYKTSWGTCGAGDGQFSNALGIHYSASNDTIIVSDTGHDRIIRFDTEGNYVDQFGSTGTGNGELDEPWGLTTNTSGDIYVADSSNHRIQVFYDDGTYLSQFGSSAPGDFELVFPKDIEILSNENLVVTSQNSQTIKKFNSGGTVLLDSWGSNGTGNDQFQNPQFLTIDTTDDSVWVTDTGLKRIQHFASDGTYMSIIQNSGTGNGQFITPYDVDFDATGNMYVLDSTNRVQKFDSSGNYTSTVIASGVITDSAVYHLTVSASTGNILVSTETNVYVFNSSGTLLNTLGNHGVNGANSGTGDFNHARGMDIDSSENVYVADLLNNRVQKFNLTNVTDGGFDGGFVTSWATTETPEEILVDGGFVYVGAPTPTGDPQELKIHKYNTSGVSQGVFLDQWGGDIGTQYYHNKGITIYNGKTYISDPNNDRVMVYNADGSFSEMIGSHGSGSEQFDGIASAKFNPLTGDLVAVDTRNHRIQIMVNGVKINNLNPSADVINTDNSLSIAKKAIDPNGANTDSLTAKLYFGDYVVSDFVVDLTQNRNWANVNTIMLPDESKSLVVNLNPTDAPGISATHSLYIVKATGQNSVRVCTDATLIADVNSSCTGYVLNEGDAGLSSVNIGGTDYWKVTGLTGTGAMGTTVSVTSTPGGGSSQSSSGNSSGGSSTGTPSCSSEDVSGIPDLFQINALGTSAKLFFTPISNTNTFYFSFSTKPNVFEHGTIATLAKEGVQNFTISHLKPNTNYYFKVRGQSGCKPGSWSNTMQIKTQGLGATREISFYKYNQSQISIVHRPPDEVKNNSKTVSKVKTIPEPEPETVTETVVIPSPSPFMEPEVITPTQVKQITPVTQPKSPPAKKCYLWGLLCW